jgi:hypothetical protein
VNALQAAENYEPPTVGQTCADSYPIQTPVTDTYHAVLSADGSTLNGPNPMGGYGGASTFAASSEGIAGMPDGSSQVVAIGAERDVYANTRAANGNWSGWALVPGLDGASGFEATSVAIAAMSNGSFEVLAVDLSGDVVLDSYSPTSGWSGWTTLATNFADTQIPQGAVAIAGLPNGDTQIAALGSDDTVYSELLYPGGGNSGLLPMAGNGGASTFVAGGVAAVGLTDGNSELAAIGQDANVYDVSGYTGNWSGWQQVPSFNGEEVYTVGIGATTSGSVQVIVTTQYSAMSVNTEDSAGNWSGWNQLQINPCANIADSTITGMPDGSSQIFSDLGNLCHN